MAVNPTRPLALIFQRRAHVPPVRHTTPNISCSQSILPSQCIPESRFLPQSDPTHSLADLQDLDDPDLQDLDDPDPEDDSNFLEDGINDDVDDFFPIEESGLEDETSPLVSGRRPPPPFVMQALRRQWILFSHVRRVDSIRDIVLFGSRIRMFSLISRIQTLYQRCSGHHGGFSGIHYLLFVKSNVH